MPKVLIVTYYWPPSGGTAVLRWLMFVKYLRDFGWEPVVYTPENPEPQETDASLMNHIPAGLTIIKSRIREPYVFYKWMRGMKKSEKLGLAFMSETKNQGFMSKIALWIRSNAFIPDPRTLWVRPSVRFLIQNLHQHPADIIVTSGPPHSMHLIGLHLKSKLGIKWIADFRDPWTNIDFYENLLLTKYADRKHKRLEKEVLFSADHVISVSPTMTEEFQNLGLRNVTTITNGFDIMNEHFREQEKKFNLIHLGSMPPSRNPENFWMTITEIIAENQKFAESLEIILAGKTDYKVKETVKKFNLEKYVTFQQHIPYQEAINMIQQAHVLLLFINNSKNAKGILTNKFFEYLSAKRPILAIGPLNGDAAKLLSETRAGKMFDFQDHNALKQYLRHLFDLYSQNKLQLSGKNIEKYHRKNLTGELVRLLNIMTS